MESNAVSPSIAGTGIVGLDDILGGGLPEDRLYLIKGTPGVGKTTMALQFLLEGVRLGESSLYITLSETEDEIRQVADSHGWQLDGLHMYELSSAEQVLRLDEENTLYANADVELKETVRVLLSEVERTQPVRVVFDSLSEIRLLAQTPVRYRRQLLALKQHFAGRRCTVLLLDDHSDAASDVQVESLAHGVITLEQMPIAYGSDRRRVRINKLRGRQFRTGYHDYVVKRGGLEVYPRLVAAEHNDSMTLEPLPSGIQAFDQLLGGGLDRGTATLVMGPAGAGKSAVAAQFVYAAAQRGEPAAMFVFEERLTTMLARARALGTPLHEHVASGRVKLHHVDPAQHAPDELTYMMRNAVARDGARVVVIDSINGYFAAMPEARFLALQMHELLSFLGARGVATILTIAQSGGVYGPSTVPVDVSYLADSVVLLRYFESFGRVRKAISMLKKRSGMHEDMIRELVLDHGIHVGPALTNFQGVLTGMPMIGGTPGGTPSSEPPPWVAEQVANGH